MDLYSLLACPVCKGDLLREEERLTCEACARIFPIVNGVPVLLPDGSVPHTEYQHELLVREEYGLWIPTLVMQSLPASAVILNLGAGNQALDLANVIRMDVTLTPYVDVVGDAHALPFKPGTFDFIFSLAVIEHLRQPFLAAQEMFDALKNGGYVYGDCNFVFAYHGYPHHYFNASEQGLEEAFARFEKLRTGVAPYQMPSFTLLMVLTTYLQKIGYSEDEDVQRFTQLLNHVLKQPLTKYDALFTEQAALYVAAGVFFFGRKAVEEPSEVMPEVLRVMWEADPELQKRYPNLYNLGTFHNILMWAKEHGRYSHSQIEDYFKQVVPFRKSDSPNLETREVFELYPFFEPEFMAVTGDKNAGTSEWRNQLEDQIKELTDLLEVKNKHIRRLESHLKRIESGRMMKLLRLLKRK